MVDENTTYEEVIAQFAKMLTENVDNGNITIADSRFVKQIISRISLIYSKEYSIVDQEVADQFPP